MFPLVVKVRLDYGTFLAVIVLRRFIKARVGLVVIVTLHKAVMSSSATHAHTHTPLIEHNVTFHDRVHHVQKKTMQPPLVLPGRLEIVGSRTNQWSSRFSDTLYSLCTASLEPRLRRCQKIKSGFSTKNQHTLQSVPGLTGL